MSSVILCVMNVYAIYLIVLHFIKLSGLRALYIDQYFKYTVHNLVCWYLLCNSATMKYSNLVKCTPIEIVCCIAIIMFDFVLQDE